jgi:hypothetical protein
VTKSEATAILQRTSTALGGLYRLQQALGQFLTTQEDMEAFYETHLKALERAISEIRDMAAAE